MSTRLGRWVGGVVLSGGLLISGIISCGGGGGGGGTGAFSNATSINVLNATPTGPGTANVNFTASSSSGPILASLTSPSLSFEAKVAFANLLIRQAIADSLGLNCQITAPVNTTCDVSAVNSTPGLTGQSGTVAAAEIIDNTGSMAITDSSGNRGPAAKSFIQELASANSNNMISIYDFETTLPALPPFTNTNNMRVDFKWAVLTGTTPTEAQNAVMVEDGGTTNLFDTILNVCTDMQLPHPADALTNSSSSNIDGTTRKSILVLTDGDDNASTAGGATPGDEGPARDAAINCLKNGNIVAFTIGLGTSISPQGASDLQAIANAVPGGLYAQTNDPTVLTQIFKGIAGAATTGFNTASITFNPPPGTGTQVTGTLSGGSATGNFSFLAQ